jgi:transcriptional regulator with XRE-family HTH domain
MQRFGGKLRTLRIKRGMTQRELARALGYITSGYISEVETDKKRPSLDLVLKVAQFFHVATDQLTRDDMEVETEGDV